VSANIEQPNSMDEEAAVTLIVAASYGIRQNQLVQIVRCHVFHDYPSGLHVKETITHDAVVYEWVTGNGVENGN